MYAKQNLWILGSLFVFTCFCFRTETEAISVQRRQAEPNDYSWMLAYARYRANDSLIGQLVPCNSDQKICFRYNLLYDNRSDTCQAWGKGFFLNCQLKVSREIYESSGEVVGTCLAYLDPCVGKGYRMAQDSRCYTTDVVQNVICPPCISEPTRHFMGDYECRCSNQNQIPVTQPPEGGLCRIPDLRYPDEERSFMKYRPFHPTILKDAPCSSRQYECFSQRRVWVESAQDCFFLLQRGPCAEDKVVVLTEENWVGGSAVCRQRNGGCPQGMIRMAYDSQCHSEREMRLSVPGYPFLNVVGKYYISELTVWYSYSPRNRSTNICGFDISAVDGALPAIELEKPICMTGNEPECDLYELYSVPPIPEFT